MNEHRVFLSVCSFKHTSCLENLDKQIDELTNACFALENSLITNDVKVVNNFLAHLSTKCLG